MPKQVKVVNVNDDTTYADIAENIVENDSPETEPIETPKTEEVGEPEPKPKPKARAKRVSKPKAVESFEVVPPTEIEPEGEFQVIQSKAKPKRAAKVKVVEPTPVAETPPEVPPPPEKAPEKPKLTRKPRVKKEEQPITPPTMPARMSRAAKREELYHSLASNALP